MTPFEIARDLASLHAILPGRPNQARRALREIEQALDADPPRPGAALAAATAALDRPDADDTEERAVLAALTAILQPVVWVPHDGDTCQLAPDVLVEADLGGDVLTDRACALYWGAGLGEDGAGRIVAFPIVH